MFICIYVYTDTYIHKCLYVYMYIYIYIHVNICIYILDSWHHDLVDRLHIRPGASWDSLKVVFGWSNTCLHRLHDNYSSVCSGSFHHRSNSDFFAPKYTHVYVCIQFLCIFMDMVFMYASWNCANLGIFQFVCMCACICLSIVNIVIMLRRCVRMKESKCCM